MFCRFRPKPVSQDSDKENIAPQKASRLSGGSSASVDRLIKPFKCPGSAASQRASERPTRKKRKISYADADGSTEDGDRPWTNEERLALANRDANRFPVFQIKDKQTIFRARFNVPLINKTAGGYDSSRPAPTLGMRRGATFIVKPLHDPSDEFAIVLYDPTIDVKLDPANVIEREAAKEEDDNAEVKAEEEKAKLNVPLMHRSLAEILGVKKQVDGERPKVPVVIDPKLAKVLRPHQIEGVKFLYGCTTGLIDEESPWMHYGRRDGLGQNAPMHHAYVDAPQTITRSWHYHHSEVRYCLSVKSGQKLGK